MIFSISALISLVHSPVWVVWCGPDGWHAHNRFVLYLRNTELRESTSSTEGSKQVHFLFWREIITLPLRLPALSLIHWLSVWCVHSLVVVIDTGEGQNTRYKIFCAHVLYSETDRYVDQIKVSFPFFWPHFDSWSWTT
jgi:hypothetical protein